MHNGKMLNCWGAKQDHWFSSWTLLLSKKRHCSCQTLSQ